MYTTRLLDNRNRAHLDEAADLIAQGEIVAFGFNGIFVFIGDADQRIAAHRIAVAKRQPLDKPGVTESPAGGRMAPAINCVQESPMSRPIDEQVWHRMTSEIMRGMRAWRAAHPKATLREMEQELDYRWVRVRAPMLEDMALASVAAD